MNLLLVADGHYSQTPDGSVYVDSVFDYAFYKRYLSVFDKVFAVIRARQVDEVPKGKKLASGDGVEFLTLPHYQGACQYAVCYRKIVKRVKEICNDERFDCAIFRLPSSTANIVARHFAKTGKPFAVEVVTDPWANFGPRAEGNRLVLNIARKSWTDTVKKMCLAAAGVSYVTERYLQKLYPSSPDSFEAFYSSVELADDSFKSPRLWSPGQKTFWLAHSANYFNSNAKGHLTVIKALKEVRDKGYDVRARFIGDGPMKVEFAKFADRLGLGEYVVFEGRLPDVTAVRRILSMSDIYILPTYSEGLPRGVLEAMAEGLPCLSSPICGIPEILDRKFLYDFDDYAGFAEGIESFLSNVSLMNAESAHNIEVAKGFSSSTLTGRRNAFYLKLKQKVEESI